MTTSVRRIETAVHGWKVRNSSRFDFSFFSTPGILTWHKRPLRLHDWSSLPTPSDLSEVAIVMQGPVASKFSFTMESLRLYRRFYPKAPLVLSTWTGCAKTLLAQCEELGVEVVQSQPIDGGLYGNLSRQKHTTLAGLNRAESLGAQFALKTRTDQRMFRPDFLEQFQVLSRTFPRLESGREIQKSRVILTYQNSFLDRPLSGSDFLQFGHTSDLRRMWESLEKQEISADLPAEQILIGNFLMSLDWPSNNLLSRETWEKAIGEVFGFIDSSTIDLFWLKYSAREFMWRRYGAEPLTEVSQRDWLAAITKFKIQ
jgi:hypothetical protein